MSAVDDLHVQRDWNAHPLRESWTLWPDLRFAFERFAALTVEATANGASGGVLEVAAAEGIHACDLSTRGLEAYVLEPSPTMLERARARQHAMGVLVPLIQGVAEATPFRDGIFDRVLCDSALDHLADPERGIREMARITAPTGRLVLTFVNYGGVTVRASRLIYRLGRRLGLLPSATARQLFWDTPVPYEHTFECTLENVRAMCDPYLELDHARGVSLGCHFPGWGRLLARLPVLHGWLRRLDRFAERRPAVADFVVSVWRPKPRAQWPVDELRTRPTNPVHRRLIGEEARYWDVADANPFLAAAVEAARAFRTIEATRAMHNRTFTGRPDRDWLDDLITRGPFGSAATLGGDLALERRWLGAGGSATLDVYDLSPGVIARVRARLGHLAPRAHFIQTDLNFVKLPEAAYDVIWTSDCLHFVTNLEHLFSQIARALRPGGLFALTCYVGERRLQFDPERLARVNAVLAAMPARFQHAGVATPGGPSSPFAAVRAPDILPLARARFEVVHEAVGSRLFPLPLLIDWAGVAREDPELLAWLIRAEAEAADDPAMTPCEAYGVYRLLVPGGMSRSLLNAGERRLG